jgi:3-deoxy-D-manno-octulosonate 8-phosphate phosphatase (KDO 8-P phosphatase)
LNAYFRLFGWERGRVADAIQRMERILIRDNPFYPSNPCSHSASLTQTGMADLQERFKQITTFIFDVDGVMTDGSVNALETGEQYRTFNIRDGYAIERAVHSGYRVAVLSAGNQISVRKRLEFLKIKDIFMGGPTEQKIYAYLGYLNRDQINEAEVLYMGDDIPDFQVLSRPNLLSTCPADAADEIKAVCDYVSPVPGGRGAVRDVIEQVMKAQGKWLSWLTDAEPFKLHNER